MRTVVGGQIASGFEDRRRVPDTSRLFLLGNISKMKPGAWPNMLRMSNTEHLCG